MNLKRAVLFGALLWVLIFFEVSILMFGFGVKGNINYYVPHYFFLAVLTALIAYLYFRGKVKGGLKEGILVALVMFATGFVLDALITVPLFVKTYSFFLDPFLILGFAESLLVVAIVAVLKK